jgi:hypothetical protein
MKQKCPLCHGEGEVDINPPTRTAAHRKIAKDMRKKGLTIRQIMGALGYKHPGSITNLLNEPKKKIKK